MQRIHHHSCRGYLSVIALTIWALTVFHGYTQGGPYVRTERTISEDLEIFHGAVSKRVLQSAQTIDEFFADDRVLDETNETQLRLNTTVRYEDGRDLTMRLSLKGRISMPYLEERFLLFFETDGRERDVRDQFSDTATVTDDDKSLFTGVRFVPRETRRSRLSLDGGLRWRGGPVPFLRVRGRRTWVLGDWAIRGTQQVFWFSDRGFGETTTLDFDRWLDETHFFRMSPSMTWAEDSRGVELSQQFNLYHYMREDTMVGFELDVEGFTRPSGRVDKYEGTLRWRQRTKLDWLFFEVAPGLNFTRERNFEPAPVITLKLEMLFGYEDLF